MAIEVQIRTPEGKLYVPLAPQAAFHASPASRKCLIGAFGSGKTLPGAVEALVQSLEMGNGTGGIGLIARYDWHELQHTTWKTFIDIIPAPIRRQSKVNITPPKVVFPNGFTVIGFNLKNHQKLQSLNLSWAWIDEVNEDGVEESTYLQLIGRLRNPVGRRHLWLTGNPAGKNWVYQRFFAWQFDATARRYANHEGFRSGTLDNIHLESDYVQGMRDTYPEDWLEKYFAGSFDVFEGQILDLRPEVHLIEPFVLPGEWARFRSVDHGLTAPTACLWTATDFEENYISYREYYQRGKVPEEAARDILNLSIAEEDLIRWSVCDPAMQGLTSGGGVVESQIAQYLRGGLHLMPGNNSVKMGIPRMQMLLRPDPEHPFPAWHPRAGELGSPRWFIFRDLRHFIQEAQQWKWKALKPGQPDREKPNEKDDHLMNCAKYFFLQGPQVSERQRELSVGERFERILSDLFPDKEEEGELIGRERWRLE